MVKITVEGGGIATEERDDDLDGVTIDNDTGAIVEGDDDGDVAGADQPEPEIIVQIGDAEPEEADDAKAPEWVRDLRKSNREKDRRIKELEAKVGGEPKEAKLGPKPTRESCDYDDEEYDRQLEKWYEDKRAVDAAEQAREDAQKAQEQAWTGKLTKYGEAKKTLGVRDYDDAETLVVDTLSITQQGIIVQGAENPALVTYALGKNPSRAKELAAISDPIEFAFAVAKLEAQLKVTDRKAPPPEKTTRGSTGAGTGSDATLDKLRAEAGKTGDYSKVVAYKREKRAH